jgi:AraC-like DNA-binding protein
VLIPRGHAFRFCSALDVPSIDATDAIALFSAVEVGNFVVVNGGGDCSGLGGYFAFTGKHSDLLLNMLPPIVHFRREEDKAVLRWYLERLMQELYDPKPGGVLMAEHMAQTLLIQALRLHVLDDANEGIGWLFALRDRQMGAALAAIHEEPGRRWTVDALATVAGMSRSSFSARFSAMVGEPAIEYLTRWRMHLAADRLLNLGTPVSVLADNLGYESESAFGAAFKRVIGQSPRQYASCVANS